MDNLLEAEELLKRTMDAIKSGQYTYEECQTLIRRALEELQ